MASQTRYFICIGETGMGKSTFIATMGGIVPDEELVQNGTSQTAEVQRYNVIGGPAPVFLIDMPGFSDTRHVDMPDDWLSSSASFSDESHATQLLRQFHAWGLAHLNGVLWFVGRNRGTESVKKEARFIRGLIKTPGASGSTHNWNHVVVMLFGVALESDGVRSAVREVAGTALPISEQPRFVHVGLEVDGRHPGDCEVLMRRRGGGRPELIKPKSCEAFLMNFHSQGPIIWRMRAETCRRCEQTGDSRGFSRCHGAVEQVHLSHTKHDGYFLRVHGPRDSAEKWKSRGKAVAAGCGSAAAVTATVLATTATIAAPNPFTAVAAAHFAHMSIAGAAVGIFGTLASAGGLGARRSASCGRFQCVIRGHELSDEEVDDFLERRNPQPTKRGQCGNCGVDVSMNLGCWYVWTCCGQTFTGGDLMKKELDDQIGGGCRALCRNERCGNPNGPGCVKRCKICKRTSNEVRYTTAGCRGYSHDC